MSGKSHRRYDVDWLRVLAFSLLIIYHISIIFQPWAYLIYFIQSGKSLESIWIFMGLINIWRIPMLFIISGMGVCFAMTRRNWKELLKERTIRILFPFLVGLFLIVPLHVFIYQKFHYLELTYIPNAGHLWFLANIYTYVILLSAIFFYLNNNPDNPFFRFLKSVLKYPVGIYIFVIPFIAEATLVNPEYFESYAQTPHGFWVGLLAFCCGFIFISLKDDFWQAVQKIKFLALAQLRFYSI